MAGGLLVLCSPSGMVLFPGAGDTEEVLLWDAHFPPIMIMHLLICIYNSQVTDNDVLALPVGLLLRVDSSRRVPWKRWVGLPIQLPLGEHWWLWLYGRTGTLLCIRLTLSPAFPWGDHGVAQAWVLCENGVSAQHWVTLSMVALAGSSLQRHISCWWLRTKWSMAILMAIIAGSREPAFEIHFNTF